MPVVITRHGIISGGYCDQRHHARVARLKGAWDAFDVAESHDHIRAFKSDRTVKFKAPLHLGWRKIANRGNAEFQIGFFRGEDVIAALKGRRIAYKKVLAIVEAVMAGEFGVDDPGNDDLAGIRQVANLLAGKKHGFGLAAPHQDSIFQARRRERQFRAAEWNPFR